MTIFRRLSQIVNLYEQIPAQRLLRLEELNMATYLVTHYQPRGATQMQIKTNLISAEKDAWP